MRLEERLGNELIEHLRNERIDVAFIRTTVADPEGLVVNLLPEEPMLVALPSGHALARSSGGAQQHFR